jgi:hypothetical protein
LYTRALTLTADELVRASIIERLLMLFDAPMLNQEPEMLAAFRELISLHPLESLPLLRLAKYQEARGSADAAEETLLAARRLAPADIEPVRTLAQFYSRRAGACMRMWRSRSIARRTPPGEPDKNGVYRVGGGITPPRRFGNAAYPPTHSRRRRRHGRRRNSRQRRGHRLRRRVLNQFRLWMKPR